MTHYGKYATVQERLKLWVVSWVSLAQEIVVIVTLGCVVPDWRAHLVLSSWIKR